MKRFSAITDLIQKKYLLNFDWYVMFLAPLIYGILLITNTSLIWSMYEFKDLFLSIALPDFFGIMFIGVSVLMLFAKKTQRKGLIALALSVSTFVWSIVGFMFLFAVPSNSVWILSAVMVGISLKIGIMQ